MSKLTNKNVHIVPQCIDVELFNPDLYKVNQIKVNLSFQPNSKIVGFLGCFTPAGIGEFEQILSVMRQVIRMNENIYFLVIGGGRLLEKYKAISKAHSLERIIFTGYIPHNEVAKYLSICDIVLIWMRKTIGDYMKGTLKILEYLCMNKLVVGYLVGETKASFGEYCIECAPTVDDFIRKINLALNYEKEIKTHQIIKENFNIKNVEEKFVGIMRSIL